LQFSREVVQMLKTGHFCAPNFRKREYPKFWTGIFKCGSLRNVANFGRVHEHR